MHQQLEGQDQEIVNRLNSAHRKVLVLGKEVFVPPIFTHRERPYHFKLCQVKLLHFLTQTNDIDLACKEAGVGRPYALKFLKSREYKEFAADAVQDQAIADGWTPRRIVLEIDQIYSGVKRISEEQLDALKMMKDIVIPKKSNGESAAGGVTVNLNFPALPVDVQSKLRDIAESAAIVDVEDAA